MNDLSSLLRKNWVLIVTLVVLIALFVVAAQGMSTKDWMITTLRGLAVGAVTFLVAAGFSIILGLMDVMNLAHGTMFMIGAYIGWSVYVRPDTFVDLLTPMALVLAGLLLRPLWGHLLRGLHLSPRIRRIWPWGVLVLALVILALLLPRTPVAIWDAEDYQDSPIVWTQNFILGIHGSLMEPGQLTGVSALIFLGGTLLGSILLGLSLAGFARAGHGASAATGPLPWGGIIAFLVVTLIGLGVYWANDLLTNFLLSLNANWLFLIAVVTATLVGAGLGGIIEISFIRPLYARPIYNLMMTLGIGFIGVEAVRSIWGRTGFTMPRPPIFDGSGDNCPATSLGGWLQHNCSTLMITIQGETARIRVYNEIFLILVGIIVLVAVWILLRRTRLGMIIRAGVQDSEMVEALGINVRQVFTLVFGLGVGLAALGGVLAGPYMGLSDGMGGNLLIGALIALAIGGMTSYPGAALGAVLVGLLQQFIIKYGQIGIPLPFLAEPFKPSPPLVPASTVLLMVIILLVMPQGLLGRKE